MSATDYPTINKKPDQMAIWQFFKKSVKEKPDHIFHSYYVDEKKVCEYSYKLFAEKVDNITALFNEFGLIFGDKIATAGFNHPDMILTYLACWKMGLCVVPINMGEDDNRLKYILSNSKPKLVIALENEGKKIKKLEPTIAIWETAKLHEVSTASVNENLNRDLFSSDALLIYTSGTTGNPKGVLLTQQNLIADAKSITEWFQITEKDVMYCVLPIHHVNGTIVTHVTPIFAGASIILQKKFSLGHFFDIIRKEKITISSVVPTLLQYLLQSGFTEEDSKSDLKFLICGAGPLTVEIANKFEEKFKIPIMHGYGLSETTCYSCFIPHDLTLQEHKSWISDFGYPSIGVPIQSNEMEIHDDFGKSLAENEKGEIVIRGKNVMKEYFDNVEATDLAFKYGWFRSGDEGFFKWDHKGRKFFFITGRFKELIIRGGINLSPLEIDEVINKCPGVKAGISVGFENDWYGEEVGAFIQKSESEITEEQILGFFRKNLPYMKQPKVVVFGDEIPVTSTGKYQRNKIKNLFAQWKTVQFK